jgi:regulator of cell morphogenesis and NO signaling
MASLFTLENTVGEFVVKHPRTSRVFEQHRIDYCCRGGVSLLEACRAANADVESVQEELNRVISDDQGNDDAASRFLSLTLSEMCDSIESSHHAYLKEELPRMTQLVAKVLTVHGAQHAWLSQLAGAFHQLREELVPHMFKEEQILFPAIRAIEQSRSVPFFPFGSVDNPIRMMEHEHDLAGQALKVMREASTDYTLPEGGCNTFLAMLDGLQELEFDLHQHIHKENNVLFPRASRLAAELSLSSNQRSVGA